MSRLCFKLVFFSKLGCVWSKHYVFKCDCHHTLRGNIWHRIIVSPLRKHFDDALLFPIATHRCQCFSTLLASVFDGPPKIVVTRWLPHHGLQKRPFFLPTFSSVRFKHMAFLQCFIKMFNFHKTANTRYFIAVQRDSLFEKDYVQKYTTSEPFFSCAHCVTFTCLLGMN